MRSLVRRSARSRIFSARILENIDLAPFAIFAVLIAYGRPAMGAVAALAAGVAAYFVKHRPIGGAVPHPLSLTAARATEVRRPPPYIHTQVGSPSKGGIQ